MSRFQSRPVLTCSALPFPPRPSFTTRQAGSQKDRTHGQAQQQDRRETLKGAGWSLARLLAGLGSAGGDWLGAANRAGLARWHWLALRPGPHTATPFFFISQLRHSFSPTSYLTSSPRSWSRPLSPACTPSSTHHPPPAPAHAPSAHLPIQNDRQTTSSLLFKVPQQSVEAVLFMGSVFL